MGSSLIQLLNEHWQIFFVQMHAQAPGA